MKFFCKRANQNKNNFRFTTLTKHVNNQTNCRITLEKMKKIQIFLIFISLYLFFQTSIIDYVKPSEMKKELNMKFKERFPKLEITFTKLRSIKRELQRIAINECHLDLLTLSQSFVYLEQLVLKNRITKINRKYCAGACLILAGKLNDVKGQSLTHLIEVSKAQFLSFKISSQIFSHQRN